MAPHEETIARIIGLRAGHSLSGVVLLHIAMFSDTYFPYISGVVRSIERLSDGLRERGHTVTIFGPRYMGHSHDADKMEQISRCPALPIYPPGNIVFPLPSIVSLTRQVRTMKVDVIHAHSPFTMGLAALQVGRRLDIPVVFTHHSVYHEYAVYFPKPLRAPTERAILHWVSHYVQQADQVVVPSLATREFVRETYGVDCAVVSNPIVGPHNGTSKSNRADLSAPILVYVGRLGKEKRLPLLIQAFSLVRKKTPAHLVLVGDGPERAHLEELAEELRVGRFITITGFLPYDQVSDWYQRANVFVFSSDKETQGMVMLEALAHGVPVVAVRSEASEAIFDVCRAGCITESEPGPMAQAIMAMLSDPQALAQMSEEGLMYAQRFSPERIAERMERVYQLAGITMHPLMDPSYRSDSK
jgi:1,2-diacylglycerol 3-alpha-glucosyltransferase